MILIIQYFTVQSEAFKKRTAAWRKAGWVAPWTGKLVSLEDGKARPSGRGQQRRVVRVLGKGLELLVLVRGAAAEQLSEGNVLRLPGYPLPQLPVLLVLHP